MAQRLDPVSQPMPGSNPRDGGPGFGLPAENGSFVILVVFLAIVGGAQTSHPMMPMIHRYCLTCNDLMAFQRC